MSEPETDRKSASSSPPSHTHAAAPTAPDVARASGAAFIPADKGSTRTDQGSHVHPSRRVDAPSPPERQEVFLASASSGSLQASFASEAEQSLGSAAADVGGNAAPRLDQSNMASPGAAAEDSGRSADDVLAQSSRAASSPDAGQRPSAGPSHREPEDSLSLSRSFGSDGDVEVDRSAPAVASEYLSGEAAAPSALESLSLSHVSTESERSQLMSDEEVDVLDTEQEQASPPSGHAQGRSGEAETARALGAVGPGPAVVRVLYAPLFLSRVLTLFI